MIIAIPRLFLASWKLSNARIITFSFAEDRSGRPDILKGAAAAAPPFVAPFGI
jgi:hypothetical protein